MAILNATNNNNSQIRIRNRHFCHAFSTVWWAPLTVFGFLLVYCLPIRCLSLSSTIPYHQMVCAASLALYWMRLCWLYVCARMRMRVYVFVYASKINVLKSREEKNEVHSFNFHSFIHSWHFLSYSVGMSMKHRTTFIRQKFHEILLLRWIRLFSWIPVSANRALSLSLTHSVRSLHSSSFDEYDDMMMLTATAKLAMLAHSFYLPRGQHNNERKRWAEKRKKKRKIVCMY